MKLNRTAIILTALTAAGLHSTAHAEGLYATALIGASTQETDSQAYGDNLGVDASFPDQFSTGDGSVGTLGLGYSISDTLRIEGRVGYHDSDFNSRELGLGERSGEEFILNGDIKSTTLTVEAFYDIPTSFAFKPYVKAGVGASRNRYAARLGGAGVAAFDPFDGTIDGFYDNYADQTSTEFSWNVGFGGRYAINERINLVAEYQYVSFGDASIGQDSFTDGFQVDDAQAHELQIGLQVNF